MSDSRAIRPRRSLLWVGALLLAVAAAVIGVSGCRHGHVIRAEFAPNHTQDFDFTSPPCEPAPLNETAMDGVTLRYLGVSGLYLQWRDTVVLTAPFFSNYSLWTVGFGSVDWDEEAIRRGMHGLPDRPIDAVLVGHSHYDHFADLPPILRGAARDAAVFVNDSGLNMIRNCDDLDNRFVEVEERIGQWIRLTDREGAELPIRVMPLASGHARHTRLFRLSDGEVTEPWECIDGKKLRKLAMGQPIAFLIDLLDDDGNSVFRIHYQDASSSKPKGYPPPGVLEERDVDLAVVCIPRAWLVDEYPEGLLEFTRARHVLVTHYEDFFRSATLPIRFVQGLTDAHANEFMERVRQEMHEPGHDLAPPATPACGPSSAGWTMPLPGEWLHFAVD